MYHFLRSLIDRILGRDAALAALQRQDKTSSATKAAQRHLYHFYRSLARTGAVPSLSETGFRCFSQSEEDGKLLFIFALLGIPSGTFVDIGGADGIDSNCANLALNFGWRGLFLDGSEQHIRRGREFYRTHPDSWLYPPQFVQAFITCENINELLDKAGVSREIDLMSIDIDGNDYWVWEALERVVPKVMIIETHIELGERSIVVPYDKNHVYPGKHPEYFGASVGAMVKLANRKGYRLVGASDYGFNTIYVRRGLAEDLLPEVAPESVLTHPRNAERAARVDPIKDWKFVEV